MTKQSKSLEETNKHLSAAVGHLGDLKEGVQISYCVHLVDIWLPPKLRRIGKEAFLCCASLREVSIPPALHYFAHRAFFGCEQLTQLIKLDETSTWRGPYAEKFKRSSWIKLLPQDEVDSDAFEEELRKGLR